MGREAESDALTDWLRDKPIRITSVVGGIELTRAARRAPPVVDEATLRERVAAVMASVSRMALSDAIADRAGAVPPPTLRSLDAIHLVTAIVAGSLDAFVTYDDRLAQAARAAGLSVVQPGRDAEASTGERTGIPDGGA